MNFSIVSKSSGLSKQGPVVVYQKYIKLYPAFCDFIDSSFLDEQMKRDIENGRFDKLSAFNQI